MKTKPLIFSAVAAGLSFVLAGAFLVPDHVVRLNASTVDSDLSSDDTVRIAVTAGWNLISLPLIVPDGRVSVLFPNARSSAFSYGGSYVIADSLEFGRGYWLKFAQSETVFIVGKWKGCCVLQLRPGWNLIGTLTDKLGIHDFKTTPEALLISPFYGYDSLGYTIVDDTLLPGRGYWIKAKQIGKMLIPFPASTPVLILPNDNSDYESNYPLFAWSEIPCKTFYHLQVAQDSTFTSVVYDDSLLDESKKRLCFPYGTTYYWRVAAEYGGGLRGGWSNTRRFTTAAPVDSLNWEFLGFPHQGRWYANTLSIAVHPENDSIIYLGIGSDFSAGQQGRIYKTTNLGATWDTLVYGVTVRAIVINPKNPDIVYVGLQWANPSSTVVDKKC